MSIQLDEEGVLHGIVKMGKDFRVVRKNAIEHMQYGEADVSIDVADITHKKMTSNRLGLAVTDEEGRQTRYAMNKRGNKDDVEIRHQSDPERQETTRRIGSKATHQVIRMTREREDWKSRETSGPLERVGNVEDYNTLTNMLIHRSLSENPQGITQWVNDKGEVTSEFTAISKSEKRLYTVSKVQTEDGGWDIDFQVSKVRIVKERRLAGTMNLSDLTGQQFYDMEVVRDIPDRNLRISHHNGEYSVASMLPDRKTGELVPHENIKSRMIAGEWLKELSGVAEVPLVDQDGKTTIDLGDNPPPPEPPPPRPDQGPPPPQGPPSGLGGAETPPPPTADTPHQNPAESAKVVSPPAKPTYHKPNKQPKLTERDMAGDAVIGVTPQDVVNIGEEGRRKVRPVSEFQVTSRSARNRRARASGVDRPGKRRSADEQAASSGATGTEGFSADDEAFLGELGISAAEPEQPLSQLGEIGAQIEPDQLGELRPDDQTDREFMEITGSETVGLDDMGEPANRRRTARQPRTRPSADRGARAQAARRAGGRRRNRR